jgi:hypothetical protein
VLPVLLPCKRPSCGLLLTAGLAAAPTHLGGGGGCKEGEAASQIRSQDKLRDRVAAPQKRTPSLHIPTHLVSQPVCACSLPPMRPKCCQQSLLPSQSLLSPPPPLNPPPLPTHNTPGVTHSVHGQPAASAPRAVSNPSLPSHRPPSWTPPPKLTHNVPGVTVSVHVQPAANAPSAVSSPSLTSHSCPLAPTLQHSRVSPHPQHTWCHKQRTCAACCQCGHCSEQSLLALPKPPPTQPPPSPTWCHTQCASATCCQSPKCSQQSLLALPQPPLSPLLQQLGAQVGAVGGQLLGGNTHQHHQCLWLFGGGEGVGNMAEVIKLEGCSHPMLLISRGCGTHNSPANPPPPYQHTFAALLLRPQLVLPS